MEQEGIPEDAGPAEPGGEAGGDDLFERWLAHRVQTAEEAEARPRTFGVTGLGARDLTTRARSTRPDPAGAAGSTAPRPAPERTPVGLEEWEPVLMPSARKRAASEDAERPRRLLGRRRREAEVPETPEVPEASEASAVEAPVVEVPVVDPVPAPSPASESVADVVPEPIDAPDPEPIAAPEPEPASVLETPAEPAVQVRADDIAAQVIAAVTPTPAPAASTVAEDAVSTPAAAAESAPPEETPRERKNRLARERRARARAEREAAEQLARDQEAEDEPPVASAPPPPVPAPTPTPAPVRDEAPEETSAPVAAIAPEVPAVLPPASRATPPPRPRRRPEAEATQPGQPAEPAQPAQPAASAEPAPWRAVATAPSVPAGDLPPQIEFTPRTKLRRLTGVLLAIGAAATLLAGAEAYRDGTDVSAGIALVLAVLTAIIWAVRAASPVARLSMHGGILEVHSAAGRHIFDLTNPYTQVESVGTPGGRGWQVRFHRRAMSPFTITAAMVDPDELMPALRYYRPEL